MDSIAFLPPRDDSDDDLAFALCDLTPGLVQWVTLLDTLKPEQHGLGVREIAEVETCCIYTMMDFESADFVVRTHDDRRFHLQGAIDADNGPDTVAISVKQMETGPHLPFAVIERDPTTHWTHQTEAFNAELARLKSSSAGRHRPDTSRP